MSRFKRLAKLTCSVDPADESVVTSDEDDSLPTTVIKMCPRKNKPVSSHQI